MKRVSLTIFDQSNEETLHVGKVWLGGGERTIENILEIDRLRLCKAWVEQIFNDEVIEWFSTFIEGWVIFSFVVLEIIGDLLFHYRPRRHICVGGTPVGDIFVGHDIFELGVSVCVGDAMRVWVAVVPFFKSSPILERVRGRVWKNSWHDHSHEEFGTDSVKNADDIWIIQSPIKSRCFTVLVCWMETRCIALEPVNFVEIIIRTVQGEPESWAASVAIMIFSGNSGQRAP